MELSNWQLGLSTHRERCKHAFDNSMFCDVEFLVEDCDGDKVTVPANKYPLAVCSPVFEAMFYGTLAETNSPIHISDCTKEGLQEVLRYAHYEEAKLTGSNVMEVLYLAKKYMMSTLEEKCQHYIRNEVGPEDVLTILPQVQQMSEENLEKHLWEIVDKNTEEVISSNSFLSVSRELLCELLKRDALKVNELNLFKAVDKWATKRIEEDKELVCNGETKRDIIGEDIIKHIRFPIMTDKEIGEVVLPCKILNADEVTELFSFFTGTLHATEIFSSKRRTPSNQIHVSEIRFPLESLDTRVWDYSKGKVDYLGFTVNKEVKLVGVRLFSNRLSTYDVELKIIENSSECIAAVSSSYATEKKMIDGLYYGFTVTLDKPVRLDPNSSYIIKAKITGVRSWCGDNGNRVVSAGDQFTITYTEIYGSRSNGTSPREGQFPSLVLQTL